MFAHVPVLVPKYCNVLGPLVRTGVRTDKWRFVSDAIVGPCKYGKEPPSRDGFICVDD